MELAKTIFFVGGRLVTATLGVLGFAFDLTGGSVLAISSSNWGIIGLVAFVSFIILTLAREVTLMWKQKPNITVNPEVHNNRATLVVTNTGGEANFTAKARVRAVTPEPALYTMCWESEPTMTCHIDGGGGIASILVAEKARLNHIDKIAMDENSDYSTTFLKGDLLLFKMDTSGRQTFPAYSGKTSKEIRNGREITSGTFTFRCIVEVTITATPAPKKKWGIYKYLCEIENGQIKLSETELSTPHMSYSQT